MLNAIFRGFDEDAVSKKAHYTASTPEIALVSQALKVTPMLQNYGVHLLLESHVPGTRQWLFDRVNKWLETALNAGEDAGTLNHRRMFLLLAGPGMGKSVFSAVMEKKLEVKMQAGQRLVLVRHFFKVGEPRAQGKAMVLCLALQLAEQLPGMAALLWLVAKEHGSADQLTLKDTFDKYLMEPLTTLDKEHSVEQPVVAMLLDAIDEATDGAAGCEPVTHLVGHQMSKLPAWVKIVLTGRPQMESYFRHGSLNGSSHQRMRTQRTCTSYWWHGCSEMAGLCHLRTLNLQWRSCSGKARGSSSGPSLRLTSCAARWAAGHQQRWKQSCPLDCPACTATSWKCCRMHCVRKIQMPSLCCASSCFPFWWPPSRL
ncbi:hypothetical protein DUNSADRAFT_3473 [Dunaliella salina]|uniref:Nephrocystin 3-like N-terminal domain-containing protein n=1 Tax=Dunaliella salina TaxID=3046 RepID=A0ABQ7GU12_DUNSA|nr:hypothetical protein DUNSADRAFT_3473 [Dunaliella salina]|eukprot:KAF5838039.1 hypothetical protein DUNSADRAFT_3473 [Dunaliella salina]